MRSTGNFVETDSTPKLCLTVLNLEPRTLRRVKQLGVDTVLMSDSNIPWTYETISSRQATLSEAGLTLGNMMIAGFPNAIYGRDGRDEDIEKVIESVRAAGKTGLPVVEYNFYAHRITEGYRKAEGRGGAKLESFDYDRVKDLPPLPEEGAHSLDEMWGNITYFLKAVIPVAVESGVRLALHPNDPPPPISRGSGQIMGSLEGWKKLVDIIDSPANGMTFDCGVTRELGEDPIEVCRYLGERDRINHVHFRNVISHIPREKYTEVFLDQGEVDMLGVMQELVRQQYPRTLYPEHPPQMDVDLERPDESISSGMFTGFAYTVGYARATMQAALALEHSAS
ncbi:MAG: mannonate dehydratase [Chloroflexi bacterium]|nr:mannonate dehydratase [Chloroflexota bacterium]